MTRSGVLKSAFGLVVAMLLTAGPSFARLWGGHKTSVKSTNITLASNVKLGNGNILKAGDYRVEVPENSQAPEVTFNRDGKVVAEAPAKLVAENTKNPHTEVDFTMQGKENVITEIRPGGWNQKLVFNAANGLAAKGGQ